MIIKNFVASSFSFFYCYNYKSLEVYFTKYNNHIYKKKVYNVQLFILTNFIFYIYNLN